MKNLGNQRLDEGEVLCWKVFSFLALDSVAQRELIGPVGTWFFDSKVDRDGTANYLFGIALLYLHCHGALRAKVLPETSNIDSLTNTIRDMLEHRDIDLWSASALNENEQWQEIRMYAEDILREAGLYLNPPKKPFDIEALIEVDGYR